MSTIDLSLENVEVNFGEGKTLVFYPLNFKALRIVRKELDTLRTGAAADGNKADSLEAICRILEVSANRKAQTTTLDELLELLEPMSANKILTEINRISGFVKVVPSQEGEAARPISPLNGAQSTQELPLQQDGALPLSTN